MHMYVHYINIKSCVLGVLIVKMAPKVLNNSPKMCLGGLPRADLDAMGPGWGPGHKNK